MKKLILILLLFCNQTFGMPMMGDYAKYKLTVTEKLIKKNFIMVSRLTAYNALQDTFTYQMKITDSNGFTVDQREASLAAAAFNSSQSILLMLKNCETPEIAGKLENILVAQVPITSCRQNIKDGSVWYGMVPFGMTKIISKNTQQTTLYELIDYQFGH